MSCELSRVFAILRSTCLLFFFCMHGIALADISDPFDPFDTPFEISTDEEGDKDKSASELVEEASMLFSDERPLDARTKLLRALRKDPQHYEAYKLLAGYYLVHVGHYRLALKYIKKADDLFKEQYGAPPYSDYLLKAQHAHLLHLLSQIRLNLDNYQGALDVLDVYADYGYFQEWYPGSRAWILMKLGKIDEAIKVARMGILAGAEPGRTLNILGILLSVNNQREASLQVFKDAIQHEMSLGRLGQPATPLNNSGEVYRETFQEELAERSWLKSVSLPDGCEHVLPSLNLAVLYIEQVRYRNAKESIDNFESCNAQYPLRNGEEHRALVHLARGRIDMHTGHIESALQHLEEAVERRQWFGKIGSSQEDLESAATISLAQSLVRQNNHLATTLYDSLWSRVESLKTRIHNKIRIWWLQRRARQILSEDLNALEDLYVRHTDSIIEYPTFGELLAGYPFHVLKQRIDREIADDDRVDASPYYYAYLAENAFEHGMQEEADNFGIKAFSGTRPRYDDALELHLLALHARMNDPESKAYRKAVEQMFAKAQASVRNYGLKLPVTVKGGDSELLTLLAQTAFQPITGQQREYQIDYRLEDQEHVLIFSSPVGLARTISVRGAELFQVINQLNDGVFSERLG